MRLIEENRTTLAQIFDLKKYNEEKLIDEYICKKTF